MANMAVNALRLTDTLQREQQGHSSLFSILSLARQQQPLAGRKTILFFSDTGKKPLISPKPMEFESSSIKSWPKPAPNR